MFKTLFSRMLATYLALTLLLLALLGVTLGAMFRNQYIDEKESELRREAAEINATIYEKYVDPEKRSVAKDQLYTIVRQYDALLQLYFLDQTLGKVVFMDEGSADKWALVGDADIAEKAVAIIESGEETVSSGDYAAVADVPVMTLRRPITDAEGVTIGAMFLHVDMSRTNASVRQVYMDVLLTALVAVLFAFLAVSYTTNRMTKPITEMNNAVKRFSRGEFEARVAVSGKDEVSQLGESFNEMADEINALEQSRRSFVANVSHELRSPLTSMRGFLEAMQDGTIPAAEQGKYLDVVIGECKRMAGMVNDLLDLARIESGTYELKLAPFDINELVIRTLLTFEARVNARRIEVVMDFENERTVVEGDSAQIAQVIRNLVDNAVKFSPEGGRLTLGIRTAGKRAVVSVRDEGEGIREEDLPYVFDRFFKGEKAHTPAGSSTGLGLSIVKRIVEQHGEEIEVESKPGGGACFTFTLRLHEQQSRARTGAQRR
ncbi:MAG TPA: ATP-binding protein [Clostridia bacterium]|nr:ATP-binding protein [Clostridia bacterium]